MAAASSRRSSCGPVMRSLSPSGRFYNSHYKSSSSTSSASAFAYSSSSFSARSSTFFNRSASPTRVNLCGGSNKAAVQTTAPHSVRLASPNCSNSITSSSSGNNKLLRNQTAAKQKRTCMCSPTTHPGSFRCSLHKNCDSNSGHSSSNYSPNNRLDAKRSAMKNSLVRIGGVEGDLVKRALSALIRPSSHQQRRRAGFQPRPSRLSIMSKA